MILTISGNPGSGKSTVAKILAEKLKAEMIYVGGMRREIARKKKMSLMELNEYAKTHPETDVEVDKFVAEEARKLELKGKKVIVEGRAQFHFLPESVKIYVVVNPKIGAERIWKDLQETAKSAERNEGKFSSLKEVEKEILLREENDAKRFQKYYGFDQRKKENYDLIVDSSKITAAEVAEKILLFVKQRGWKV